MDLIFPPHLNIARNRFRYIPSAGTSRGMYSGALQAAALGGDRVACSLEMTPAKNRAEYAERAALHDFIMNLGGPVNPVYMWDHSHVQRGSFPAPELISNYAFASGTTGWTSESSYGLSVTDRVLRATRSSMTGAAAFLESSSGVTVTQYAPYAFRALITPGRGSFGSTSLSMRLGSTLGNAEHGGESTGRAMSGLQTVARVALSTTAFVTLADNNTSGLMAGDYVQVPYTSLSRCILVDGGINSLLRSDELDSASWTRTGLSTVTAGATAPDGTTAADALVENSSTSQHGLTQIVTVSSAAADLCLACAFRANGRNFAYLQMVEATGASSVHQTFNLSTGAVGTSTSTGANWSNLRSFIVPLGNGWYYCCIVARKTNAATSITTSLQIASTDSASTYLGNGSSGIYAWRATFANSALPVRLTATTSAIATDSGQAGSGIYVKGLPASTSGLLRFGDWVEVVHSLGSSLHMVTATLNSDAAGLGYLQIAPRIRQSPSADSAIIVHRPMGRFACISEFPEWANDPGLITTASLEFEEA